jgi:hypothetical protein
MTEKEAINIAAGLFLCEELPLNWGEMNKEEQDAFLEYNAWQPFAGFRADAIYDYILDLAISMLGVYRRGREDAMQEAAEEVEQAGGREPVSVYEKLSTAYCEAIKK